MKILHVISSLETGGAQRLLSDLLPLLNNSNQDISLLLLEDIDCPFRDVLRVTGIKINSLGVSNFYNPIIIWRLIPYFRKYEIVHIHLFPVLYWASLASWFTANFMVYTEHSTKNRRRGKWLFKYIEKLIYHSYDRIISISEQTQDELKNWLQVNGNDGRFVVVENGINLTSFRNTSMSSSLNYGKDTKNLIMISRFTQAKDHKTVIRAMLKVKDEKVHLLLVGEGETMHYCRNLVCDLKLESRVHFLGRRNDIPQLIKASYLGIQSSHWEGFGLTAVEIMAGGIPIVASEVDGLKQVVEGAGCLFECGNDSELAYIVNDLLQDRMKYEHFVQKGMDRSCRYDIHLMAEKYGNIYKELIE